MIEKVCENRTMYVKEKLNYNYFFQDLLLCDVLSEILIKCIIINNYHVAYILAYKMWCFSEIHS